MAYDEAFAKDAKCGCDTAAKELADGLRDMVLIAQDLCQCAREAKHAEHWEYLMTLADTVEWVLQRAAEDAAKIAGA